MNDTKQKRVRKPLEPEELKECLSLKSIFEAEKAKNQSLTQDSLSETLGYKTQGAISHYLNGVHPLNLETAIKFAIALNCKIEDFSPRLAAIVAPLHKLVSPDFMPPAVPQADISDIEQNILNGYRAADAKDRELILFLVDRALKTKKPAATPAMESAAFHPPLPEDADRIANLASRIAKQE